MRKLLILSFFLPLMAWAQSPLPPCPETGYKHNCFGTITYPSSGNKYVGEFRNNDFNGLGIFYLPSGSVLHSGRWQNSIFAEPLALDTNRFPCRMGFEFARLGILMHDQR